MSNWIHIYFWNIIPGISHEISYKHAMQNQNLNELTKKSICLCCDCTRNIAIRINIPSMISAFGHSTHPAETRVTWVWSYYKGHLMSVRVILTMYMNPTHHAKQSNKTNIGLVISHEVSYYEIVKSTMYFINKQTNNVYIVCLTRDCTIL